MSNSTPIVDGGMPSLTAGEAGSLLTKLWISVATGTGSFGDLPATMLWGPPGIGKSQAVRQAADKLEQETGRRVILKDVRLSHFTPSDVHGLPVINAARDAAVWLKPKVLDMDPATDVVNLLFLDELNTATAAVQACAYQLVLDRACGEYAFPDNVIVVAAGNRASDRSVSFRMPKALSNRLVNWEVHSDQDAWHAWAVARGVNPLVVGYVSANPHRLDTFDPADDSPAFATPRTWEMAGKVIDQMGGDLEAAMPFVAGLVGTGVALEFESWCSCASQLPSIPEIFKTGKGTVPKKPDALYMVTSALVAHAAQHFDDKASLARGLRYAQNLPPDFRAMVASDLLSLSEGAKAELLKIPEFHHLMGKGGRRGAV